MLTDDAAVVKLEFFRLKLGEMSIEGDGPRGACKGRAYMTIVDGDVQR